MLNKENFVNSCIIKTSGGVPQLTEATSDAKNANDKQMKICARQKKQRSSIQMHSTLQIYTENISQQQEKTVKNIE